MSGWLILGMVIHGTFVLPSLIYELQSCIILRCYAVVIKCLIRNSIHEYKHILYIEKMFPVLDFTIIIRIITWLHLVWYSFWCPDLETSLATGVVARCPVIDRLWSSCNPSRLHYAKLLHHCEISAPSGTALFPNSRTDISAFQSHMPWFQSCLVDTALRRGMQILTGSLHGGIARLSLASLKWHMRDVVPMASFVATRYMFICSRRRSLHSVKFSPISCTTACRDVAADD